MASAPIAAAIGFAKPISITARRRRAPCSRPGSRSPAVGAALLVGWALYGSERLELIVGWISLVAFANWTTCRHAMESGSSAGSRSARGRPKLRAIAEAVGLAGLWARFPLTPSPPRRTRCRS